MVNSRYGKRQAAFDLADELYLLTIARSLYRKFALIFEQIGKKFSRINVYLDFHELYT